MLMVACAFCGEGQPQKEGEYFMNIADVLYHLFSSGWILTTNKQAELCI
jgi:hypothetical protein